MNDQKRLLDTSSVEMDPEEPENFLEEAQCEKFMYWSDGVQYNCDISSISLFDFSPEDLKNEP